MEKYKFGVFIGRFQPFHNSHLRAVQTALKNVDELIIIVGSANASRSIKNPFTFEERKAMIESCIYDGTVNSKVHIIPARDYFYSDTAWAIQIQNIVHQITGDDPSTCLVGNYKDASSYYINLFPQWELLQVAPDHINATDIRSKIFQKHDLELNILPKEVIEWLTLYFFPSEEFINLTNEYDMVCTYKEKWNNSPFPPIFVTVDAVVVIASHVLVVRRKFVPGKGLLALPGGFIREHEKLENACIRELREETSIKLSPEILRAGIQSTKVFDHPGRSTRGRTITHAYYIKPNTYHLPEVKGGDDASQAMWIPLRDIYKDGLFYEDHADIISSFISN